MTGRDLFRAMEYIDDELVNEAEHKMWQRRSFPVRRWCALAACLCVLAVSMTAVSVSRFSGGNGSGMDKSAEMAGGAGEDMMAELPEDAPAEGAPVEEQSGVASQEAPAENGADTEDGSGAESGSGANGEPGEEAGETEDTKKQDSAGNPAAGEVLFDDAVMRTIQAHEGENARFLLSFELYDGETLLAQDSAAFRRECERLQKSGIELTEVSQWTYAKDGSRREQTVRAGIFTAEQLRDFPADAAYGYRFVFVANGDGSPVSAEGDVIAGQ